jgi:monoamine oxidase
MKRRKFIRQLGYALPASLAFSALSNASCKKNEDDGDGIQSVKKFKNYRVIVIGAGASGLYAGWYLSERGFNVSILEASNVIGGRVRHLSGFADFDIELGAEEIHGNNSEWYRIVQQTGASIMTDTREDYYFFRQDPTNQNEPILKTGTEANQYNEYLKAMSFVDNASSYTGPDITVEQHLAGSGISWSLFDVVNAKLGNEYGTSNNRLSIKGLAEEDEKWTAGPDSYLLKSQTMLSVLETKFAPVLGKVVKNTQVKKVDYSGAKVILTDQTGKTWEADRVIITVPLKVLQDGDVIFTPSLSSTKMAALENIGMGAGIKAVFKFSQIFWENVMVANLGSILGYPNVPEVYATNFGRGETPVLTAFIMGEKAEQFGAQGSGAAGAILAHLDNIFGGSVASQSKDGAYVMNWAQEPFIKGAYSYPIVGGGLIFRKELASPVGERIFFAGEATHDAGHSGTVHGAIETGMRAANELESTIA